MANEKYPVLEQEGWYMIRSLKDKGFSIDVYNIHTSVQDSKLYTSLYGVPRKSKEMRI